MQFVEKIGETFNKTGKDVLQLIDVSQIIKRIEEEKEKQKKIFTNLGEKYYEEIKENPSEEYKELVSKILEYQKVINEQTCRLKELNEKKTCCYCGAVLVDGAMYCAQCGREVKRSVVVKCSICGSNIEKDDVYCSGCGKKIER